MFIQKTWVNLPITVYPFQPSFDKQAVSEINANLHSGSVIKI